MQKMKKTIEASGSDLFICFTSRPSASSSSAATAASMRVPSSKSLMSPNRSGASNASIPSLSSSLSRRLRSSGSIKGGQSPMFPAAGSAVGRKKGVAFEAAEPSSPKVTCIGQVRVKSKKKKSKNAVARTRSGREASFRRSEAAGGRKAVSICDALRAFGSEMNCFVPCGWSLCSSGEQEQEQRKRKKRSSSSSSCGAAFARWLMAIEEEGEEAEKGRELVGLVVEERGGKGEVGVFVREKEVELEVEEFFERRKEGIFERKGEVVVLEKEVEEEEEEEEEAEEEKGRVSVCIPPRNALLLMRCRSDPVRMAALANRFCDSPAMKVQCEEEEEVDEREEEEVVESKEKDEEEGEGELGETHVEQVSLDAEEVEKGVILDEQKAEALEEEKIIVAAEDTEKVEKEVNGLDAHEGGGGGEEEEEILGEVISAEEAAPEEEKAEGTKATDDELIEKEVKEEEILCVQRGGEDEGEEVEIILRRSISCSATKSNELVKAKEGAKRRSFSYREKKEKRRHSFSMEREARRHSFCSEKEARRSSFSIDKDGRRWSFSIEKENLGPKEKPIVVQSAKQSTREELPAAKEKTAEAIEPKITEKTQAAAAGGAADEVREKIQVSKRDETQVVFEKEKKSRGLPDCLLLMMYEPKLSMEVSKETWVCSTDFRWRPNYSHPTNQPPSEAEAMADDGGKAKDKCAENKNVIAAVTTANAAIAHPPPSKPPPTVSGIEQKLLKSSAIGPLPQPPYEHFVLTRCKSEPLKSSARLAPDACFWKSRHQPIGAAGIGF